MRHRTISACVLFAIAIPAACGGGGSDSEDGGETGAAAQRCVYHAQTFWTCADMNLDPTDAWHCSGGTSCPSSSETDCSDGCCTTTHYLETDVQSGTCDAWTAAGSPPPGAGAPPASSGDGSGGGSDSAANGQPCGANADCPRDSICDAAACVQVCGANSFVVEGGASCQCDPGFVADSGAGFCRPGCASNDDCELNEICSGGDCVQVCGEHAYVDGDLCRCETRYEFESNEAGANCVPAAPCDAPQDCRRNQVCQQGACFTVCGEHAYVDNQFCRCDLGYLFASNDPGADCQPASCQDNSPCARNQLCLEGYCTQVCGDNMYAEGEFCYCEDGFVPVSDSAADGCEPSAD